jgi:hypothetical protein
LQVGAATTGEGVASFTTTAEPESSALADGSSIDYSGDPDEGVAEGRKKSMVIVGILSFEPVCTTILE